MEMAALATKLLQAGPKAELEQLQLQDNADREWHVQQQERQQQL